MTTVSKELYSSYLDSWIGTPFRHNCRMQYRGVDCINLALAVHQFVGIISQEDAELDQYGFSWWLTQDRHPAFDKIMTLPQYRMLETNETPQLGDVMAYRWGRANFAHAGLWSQRDTVIHAVANPIKKVIESHSQERRYLKHLTKVFRPLVEWVD